MNQIQYDKFLFGAKPEHNDPDVVASYVNRLFLLVLQISKSEK